MTEDEKTELQKAEEICRLFLACDLEVEGDTNAKTLLARILGRDSGVDDDDGELEYV